MEVRMAGMAVIAIIATTGLLVPVSALTGKYSKPKSHIKLVKNRSTRVMPVEQSIEVNVPAIIAFQKWREFENFPHFLSDVIEVKKINGSRLLWRALIRGSVATWESEITELITGERMSWRSIGDIQSSGIVTLCPVTSSTTWVTVQMEYPHKVGSIPLADQVKTHSRRLQNDLKNYKSYIENQGSEVKPGSKGHSQICVASA